MIINFPKEKEIIKKILFDHENLSNENKKLKKEIEILQQENNKNKKDIQKKYKIFLF